MTEGVSVAVSKTSTGVPGREKFNLFFLGVRAFSWPLLERFWWQSPWAARVFSWSLLLERFWWQSPWAARAFSWSLLLERFWWQSLWAVRAFSWSLLLERFWWQSPWAVRAFSWLAAAGAVLVAEPLGRPGFSLGCRCCERFWWQSPWAARVFSWGRRLIFCAPVLRKRLRPSCRLAACLSVFQIFECSCRSAPDVF